MPAVYVTTTASLGFGWLGSVGSVVFFAYTYSFCSTSIVDLSANLTSSLPLSGVNTSDSVVLFDLSVTVAPANRAASLPSASCTLSANAAPFFQKSAFSVSPTHAARSTPFSPPASVIVSADVFFEAVAVNALFCAVTTLSAGVHAAGAL